MFSAIVLAQGHRAAKGQPITVTLPGARLPAASHLRVAASAVPETDTRAPPGLARKRSGGHGLSATRAQTAQRGAGGV